MGIFKKIFSKNKTKKQTIEEYKPIPEQDQASGYEPILRYPGSVMTSHSGINQTTSVEKEEVYIKYETTDRFDVVANWYKDQMERDRWKIEAWSPPHFTGKGPCRGTTGFITLVYQKENISCNIGTKYRPKHTLIWIDYRKSR